MSSSRTRWLFGGTAFLAPTLLFALEQLVALAFPRASLPGGLLYIVIIMAAGLCGALVLTAPIPKWQRLSFAIGVWCLLVLQVLLLGAFALMTGGLEGIQ
jgi:disulfide bond formation protein DsbB